MFAHPKSRLILRTGALVGLLALTPLAFTAGGQLGQNDACAANSTGDKCCAEWNSVCTLGGETHIDYYLTGALGPCGG